MPTAKKTTARKTAAAAAPPARRAPLVDLDEDAFDQNAVEQVPAFSIDGVDYTIPSASPAGVLIEFVRLMREREEDVAMWWLLDELVGAEGVAALKGDPRLTLTNVRKVYRACLSTVSGPKA